MCYTQCLFLKGGCEHLSRLALLKRYWLVFFRAPWSGTARCRPGRWMVRPGLWKWAFMHYVGYSSMFVWDVDACDVTVALCSDHRTYCNTEEKHEHRHLTQIQAIKLFMTSRRPNLKCKNHAQFYKTWFVWGLKDEFQCGAGDRELIQEVLFDAVVTAPLEAYWTGLALNKSEYENMSFFTRHCLY